MNLDAALARQPALPAAGRIVLAAIFLFSGISKLLAPDVTLSYIVAAGLPFAMLGLVAAIAIEIGGGAMLALGFRTRVVALLLTLFVLAIALFFHHLLGDPAHLVQFMKYVAMAGGLLQVVAFGAGAWSVDAMVRRRDGPQVARA